MKHNVGDLKPVSQTEFYNVIGPLDVEVTVRGRYADADYGADFRLKNHMRTLVGRTVKGPVDGVWKPDTSYFLAPSVARSEVSADSRLVDSETGEEIANGKR